MISSEEVLINYEYGMSASNLGKEMNLSITLGDKNDEIIDCNLDKGQKFTKFVGSLYNYDDRSKSI